MTSTTTCPSNRFERLVQGAATLTFAGIIVTAFVIIDFTPEVFLSTETTAHFFKKPVGPVDAAASAASSESTTTFVSSEDVARAEIKEVELVVAESGNTLTVSNGGINTKSNDVWELVMSSAVAVEMVMESAVAVAVELAPAS